MDDPCLRQGHWRDANASMVSAVQPVAPRIRLVASPFVEFTLWSHQRILMKDQCSCSLEDVRVPGATLRHDVDYLSTAPWPMQQQYPRNAGKNCKLDFDDTRCVNPRIVVSSESPGSSSGEKCSLETSTTDPRLTHLLLDDDGVHRDG